MDSGEEIPALNEDWNFLGANAVEWVSGMAMFLIANEMLFHGKTASSMPYLIMIWIGTTVGLASIRKKFPDESRGVRNFVMTSVGFEPPGIPAPAILQPNWSGAPVRTISEKSEFSQLGLDQIFLDLTQSDDEEEGKEKRAHSKPAPAERF